uniref:Uncharacterized protein n=1 Tax=Rattus norvegicus TaxID=10116 RepID=M0RAW8_RAT
MEYPNTPEKQDLVSKSFLIMMLEDFKKDVKNSLREQVDAYREESQKCLKEFQENINKQVEAHREETQKSLKEFQENTIKQLKELKMEIEAIKKEHKETTLDIEKQKKRQGAVDTSFTNRIQEMEERISGAEDSIEIIDSTVKDNVKQKKALPEPDQYRCGCLATYRTECGDPNGGVRRRTEGAEGVCKPTGRTTISTNQTPQFPGTNPPTKEEPMAPATYVAEDGLIWHQWEGRSLVLWRLDASV